MTTSDESQGGLPIDFPPKTAHEFFQRGLKNAQLGIPDKAAEDFEEAAWMEPENSEIQFNLGTAYLSMGDFEQAIVNFDRAIALRPGFADAHGNRAVAHTAIGEDEKSARCCKGNQVRSSSGRTHRGDRIRQVKAAVDKTFLSIMMMASDCASRGKLCPVAGLSSTA